MSEIDQLNEHLHQLLGNTRLHFSKRRKLLLQLERKNNQYRRSINRLDLENQKKLTINSDLIRQIKKIIIEEERQQSQRRRDEHEQNRNWSLSGMIIIMSIIVIGVISIATFTIMFLDKSKEKYI